MSKKIEEMTAQELETRQAEIVKECETAEGDALKELEAEATRICERKKQLAAAEKRKPQIPFAYKSSALPDSRPSFS